jgi:N-(2-amino-2-carboxyethyl)-L-glutamate synthase
MKIIDNVLELIGKTPVMKLQKLFPEKIQVYAKLEGLNLTGSMKARSALGMIEAAEYRGDLKPGYTIIESTSGNLGYALAVIGRAKGYKVILVLDPKTDILKRNILRAYGAKLEIVQTPDEYGAYQTTRIKRVQELLKITPNSWSPFQYGNEDNATMHYITTGPEIYEAMNGQIDVVVGSVGTCGHLGGTAKYLKERIPNLKVVGVEPEGSVLSGGKYHPYLTQGPGLSFIPKNLDRDIISEIVKVSDKDAFMMARKLALTEGLLYGASAGSVLQAVKQIEKNLEPGAKVVVILPDDGFRYAMNFYSDEWLFEKGLLSEMEKEGEKYEEIGLFATY